MGDALFTARLHLRSMAAGDAGFHRRLYADAEVMRHVGAPLSGDASRRAFALSLSQAHASPPRARYWIVRVSGTAEDCGLLALVDDRDPPGSAEAGMLLLPEAQGRGYAAEAIAALADHAFSGLAMQQLWTRHHRDNRAAVGLMQALDFSPDGADGSGRVRWSLRREDWRTGARQGAVFAKHPAEG